MALAEIGVVLGIIASIATIGGFVLKWRKHRQPQRNEPRERLARDVAAELVDLKRRIDTAWMGIVQWGEGWADRPDLAENFKGLHEEGLAMDRRVAEIDSAFGPGTPSAQTIKNAADAAEDVHEALKRIAEESGTALDEVGHETVRGYFREDRDKIREARDRFEAAQGQFAGAAAPPK